MKFITFRKATQDDPDMYWTKYVIFPEDMVHSEMRNVLRLSKDLIGYTVFSAGFVNSNLGTFICHGHSESLKIEPTPEEHDLNSKIMLLSTYGPMYL